MTNFNSYKKELLFTTNLSTEIRNNRVKQLQEWLIMQAYVTDDQINILEKINREVGRKQFNDCIKFK